MQSPNPHIYDGDYLDLDYRTPSLPVFDSPGGSLAGPSQVPVGTRRLPLLQSKDWDSDFEDDETNPTCIHYDIEWKLQLRKGRLSKLAEITEEDLTLAPSAYWDRFLSAELAKMVASKLPSPEHEPVETTVVVSVDKRSERNLRKQVPGLSIQWKAIEDKIQSWSPLLCEGHKLRLDICFIYQATNQEDTSGRRPVWNEVYEIFHCTGVPCVNAGFYCWRDPVSKKHFKLDTNLLNKLVDYAEEGGLLRNHDHVPETIRERIFRQDQENLERKQLKRKRTDSLPPINISVSCAGSHDEAQQDHPIGAHTTSTGASVGFRRRAADIVIPMPIDRAGIAYYVAFFTDKGVALGIALSYIGDIPVWADTLKS
ncbi:hypothetical protein H9L39_14732 [Fusarium oxysporum f. sp. albedinis]|nr:hypothetical protein H9L39_14732 [Fusarium oxysporum f. sp. albedinis]